MMAKDGARCLCFAYTRYREKTHMPEPKYAMPGVMTVRELSSYLRVHPSTIYKLFRRGKLPGLPDRDRLALQF